MNTLNWSKHIGSLGNLLFRIRGFTPYPIVLFFAIFATPTITSAIQGCLLIFFGEILRIYSVAYAGKETRLNHFYAPRLITNGPYAFTRNPIYIANIIIYSGVTIMANIWLPQFLFFVWIYFGFQYVSIVLAEEKSLENVFKETYLTYKKAVPRWWFRLTPFEGNFIQPNFYLAIKSEKSSLLSLCGILLIFYFRYIYFKS